jgi:hypothetical protein
MRVLIRQCPCRAPSPPLRPQRLSPRNVTQSCHLHLGRAPALEHTSHTYYTEVLRNPLPPPRMAECARALAKTKADNLKNSPRRCVNPFSLSKLSHAFTGKYCTSSVSMQSRAEQSRARRILRVQMRSRPTDSQLRRVFDCPRYCTYTATRAANPCFDFDNKTGRPMRRLHGVLRNAKRTHALLLFLETTRACFKPRPLEGPRMTGPSHTERQALRGLG